MLVVPPSLPSPDSPVVIASRRRKGFVGGRKTKEGREVLQATAAKQPMIKAFSGDTGHPGATLDDVEKTLKLKPHTSTKSKNTFAWLGHDRRSFKDAAIRKLTAEN